MTGPAGEATAIRSRSRCRSWKASDGEARRLASRAPSPDNATLWELLTSMPSEASVERTEPSTEIVPRPSASSSTCRPCAAEWTDAGPLDRKRRTRRREPEMSLPPSMSKTKPAAERRECHPLDHQHDTIELRIVAHVFDDLASMKHRRAVPPEARSHFAHGQAQHHMRDIHGDLAHARHRHRRPSRSAQLLARYGKQGGRDVDQALAYFERGLVAALCRRPKLGRYRLPFQGRL